MFAHRVEIETAQAVGVGDARRAGGRPVASPLAMMKPERDLRVGNGRPGNRVAREREQGVIERLDHDREVRDEDHFARGDPGDSVGGGQDVASGIDSRLDAFVGMARLVGCRCPP